MKLTFQPDPRQLETRYPKIGYNPPLEVFNLVWAAFAMLYLMACISLFGAILGMIVDVKVLALITALWLLVALALSPFLSGAAIISWVVGGIVLQCGYFLGLLMRVFLKPGDRTVFRRANWSRASRLEPPPTNNDAL